MLIVQNKERIKNYKCRNTWTLGCRLSPRRPPKISMPEKKKETIIICTVAAEKYKVEIA